MIDPLADLVHVAYSVYITNGDFMVLYLYKA